MGDERPLAAIPETDARPCPHEDVFQALPPLGSVEFVHFVQTAAVTELPPEVLVRVFRQLPPTSEASRVVLERLFRKRGECWDYLGALIAFARRRSRRFPRDEYQDLLQDTAERILRILPTDRAQLAERSWNAFCYRELIEAWREKYGRRGERYPREDQADDESKDLQDAAINACTRLAPWHGTLEGSSLAVIEGVAHRVVQEIENDFHRAVASEVWFRNSFPRVSGKSKPNEDPPLTTVFDGKSRFQIGRALRNINAQLAAALLAEPSLEWTSDLKALLIKLKGTEPAGAGSAEE